LDGRHQGLNNEYVALSTIGLKLHAQAVVCKSLDLRGKKGDFEMAADFGRQPRMGAAAEDRDFAQRCLPWHAPSDQSETLITDAFRAIKSVD
jgi:hypothetical protein